MLLTGEQAKEHITLSSYSKITQAGVDLSVNKIEKIQVGYGVKSPFLLKDKTLIPKEIYTTVSPVYVQHEGQEILGWHVFEGAYSVTFNEGIKIPNNMQAKVTHRSSIYRIANIIESPWWDAGFYCDNMNTTMIVKTPMFIEVNARLAQVVFYQLSGETEAYNGQFQNLSSAIHL